MSACPKLKPMGYFEDRLTALLAEVDTSLYKIALSIGQDPGRISSALYHTKSASFEKRLKVLREITESPLLKGKIDFPTMSAWLVRNYVPDEALKVLIHEKLEADPLLKSQVEQHRRRGANPPGKRLFLQKTLFHQDEM